ncbi:hypothetical protein ACFFGH_10815 [Lysobacter korlensis]|uniref:Uncharacterized protein n=1 Tax=Lysobacter korlensis TaxID=553636 RepID=A0ABV6RNF1_9GAMM
MIAAYGPALGDTAAGIFPSRSQLLRAVAPEMYADYSDDHDWHQLRGQQVAGLRDAAVRLTVMRREMELLNHAHEFEALTTDQQEALLLDPAHPPVVRAWEGRPRFVYCRQWHPGRGAPRVHGDAVEIDARTPGALLRSLRSAGLLSYTELH